MTGFEGMLCSAAAQEIPLPGSATRITGWLCVEQPGAWGRDVIGDEVLGAEITVELAARTKAAHVRPMLIRRPGRNEFEGVRTVLIASSRPEGSWCERFEITDLKQLLDLDLHLLNGPAPGIGVPVTDPLVLVCAHGKRDQCCALLGRPIAAGLAAAHPDVWECSHTGGHRFAPAVVLLPTGLTYGRLDQDSARTMLDAARRGEVSLTGLRGRSCYTPVEQVAEVAVRQRIADESFTVGNPAPARTADNPAPARTADNPAPARTADNPAPVRAADGPVPARAVDGSAMARPAVDSGTGAGRSAAIGADDPGVGAGDADSHVCVGDLVVEAAPAGTPVSGDPATFAGAAIVTHRDGRRWLVTARTVAYAPRQASCGAGPKPATAVVADSVRLLD